ncbi:hypothetical protein TNCV_2831231 [Trichonephila clavipes]|nr:hypothetical protein TNCV_2831231 [Trichonephila clavipes]
MYLANSSPEVELKSSTSVKFSEELTLVLKASTNRFAIGPYKVSSTSSRLGEPKLDILRVGSDRRGKIADIFLIPGKEFRNWVVKNLDPLSQTDPTVTKRRRNIVISFSLDSGTTARLKTYNVHLDIGAQRARDEMSLDRQGRPKKKEKKELEGERRVVHKESERTREETGF